MPPSARLPLAEAASLAPERGARGDAMVDELINILRMLDRFVGQYPIYLYLVDGEQRIRWFNQFMAEMLPAIHIGQPLEGARSLWPSDEEFMACLDEGDARYPNQVRRDLIRTRIGTGDRTAFLEFFNFPVYQSPETLLGVLRVGIDVTDHEMRQVILREKETLFTTIINTSSDAVLFLDADGVIRSWNKGAEEIFGYASNEIIGQPKERLIPKELLDLGEMEFIRKELETRGSLKRYETQRLRKDGKTVFVDISSTHQVNADGTFIGTSEIIKDISSRKELEFELLRTILELSKVNELNEILHRTYEVQDILRIILIAITAGEGLRFNRAFLLLVDHVDNCICGNLAIGPSDRDEANRIWSELNRDRRYLKDIVQAYEIDLEGVDRTVNEIVKKIRVPLDDDENHILIQALQRKRILHVRKGRLVGAEGLSLAVGDSDLPTLLNSDTFVVAPLFSKTEVLGVIIADNCISRREITTEDMEGLKLFANQASSAIENARLYQTLEMRIRELQVAYGQLAENQTRLIQSERLAAIGEITAKVAHEIRNPLVSIGGFARLLERRVGEDSSLKQYASIIKEQVANLEHILTNILSAARPITPDRKAIDLNEVCQGALTVLEAAIERRNVVLSADLDPELHPVEGDAKLLYQVVLNLLKNAIEALDIRDDGGEISVTTRNREGEVQVEIADNGPGIHRDLHAKIFQQFFTTKSSGTGLGLTIVRQIVESHNGRVDIDSEEGRGTTFFIALPAVVAEPAGDGQT